MNAPPGKWEPWDCYAVYRRLMHGESHYWPWEIQRLTEPEMLAALDDDLSKRRPPSYGTALMTDADVQAYLERMRSMTPRERLQAAREE